MKNPVVILQNSLKTTYLFRLTYIKSLLKMGYRVIVIAPNDDEDARDKLISLGCDVKRILPISKTSVLLVFIQMNAFVLRYRLSGSVFICHFLVTLILTCPTVIAFNKKLIMYTEGLGSFATNSRFKLRFIQYLIRNIRGVRLYCNESERLTLDSDANSKVTGGIGIDVEQFLQGNMNLRLDEFSLLYVGRLIGDKGVFDAIDTLDYLLSKGIRARLSLVGSIYQNNPSSLSRNDILELERNYGESIQFLGYLNNKNQLKELYKSSHLLLLPSNREGFPVCVMEASACGCLSICYDVPGCREAIYEGMNGYLVKNKDSSLYALKVEEVLSNKQFVDKEKLCKEVAVNNFSRLDKDKIILNEVSNICG